VLPSENPPARVVVTAGAAGIGLAIATRFLRGGARVAICDISDEALAEASRAEPAFLALKADVGRPLEVERLFGDILEQFERVDVLVNNAGIGGQRAPIEWLDYDAWDDCIRTNLSGVFYCMRQVIPVMKALRSGAIVNIATSSVRTGLPQRLPYVASKGGLIALTYNAARELGPFGITCNAVSPGLIDNARGRALVQRYASEHAIAYDEAEAASLAYVSTRRWTRMEEVAEAVYFLAGAGARQITGQEIGVCGNAEWEG